MRTRITELFGIKHPIIQGGMHHVGYVEMAAAVSNAGGLGIITGLTQKTPELLAREIARCHDMTDKPFGVNLTFLPSFASPPYPEYIRAIVEGGIRIVETAGRSPEAYMPALKAAGIKVIHKCTSVRHSLKAESIAAECLSRPPVFRPMTTITSTSSAADAQMAATDCQLGPPAQGASARPPR